jgi:HPt (histidine-containing phosphotransfer) domain-containing protein
VAAEPARSEEARQPEPAAADETATLPPAMAEPAAAAPAEAASTAAEPLAPQPVEEREHAEPAAMEHAAVHEPIAADGEDVRRIGPVLISHGLFNVFLSEADEGIRTLAQDVAEWRFEPGRPVSSTAMRCAHSLAGITATVGLETVWALADPLDDLLHEMSRLEHATHAVLAAAQFDSLERVIERIRGMLHQFAAGIYPSPAPTETEALRELISDVRSSRALAADRRRPSRARRARLIGSRCSPTPRRLPRRRSAPRSRRCTKRPLARSCRSSKYRPAWRRSRHRAASRPRGSLVPLLGGAPPRPPRPLPNCPRNRQSP